MKPIPILGQRLFMGYINDGARRWTDKITPVVVTRVGRKYFSVRPVAGGSHGIEIDFCLDSWEQRNVFTPSSKLYASEGEWEAAQVK